MEFSSKDEWRRSQRSELKDWLKSQGLTVRASSEWPDSGATPFAQDFLNHFRQSDLAPGLWGAFVPLPSEPPVDVFFAEPSPIRWCFPKTLKSGLQMRHTHFNKDNFEFGSAGVWEPLTSRSSLVEARELKGVFIPGVGFDRQGHRMGRGGGYYDRFLSGFKGRKIAIAYSCQLSEKNITTESHDQNVDEIWTELERVIC